MAEFRHSRSDFGQIHVHSLAQVIFDGEAANSENSDYAYVFTLFSPFYFLRHVAWGVLNSPQLRGQEPAIEPVIADAVCDVGLAGRSAVVDASDPNRHRRDRWL